MQWVVCGGLTLFLAWFLGQTIESMSWLLQEDRVPSRLTVILSYADPQLIASLWSGGQPGVPLRVVDRIPPLLAAGLQISVAGLTGRLCFRLLVGSEFSKLACAWRICLSTAGGLQLWSLWTLLVGIAGGLHEPRWFYVPATLVVIASVVHLARQPRSKSIPSAQPIIWRDHAGLALLVPFVTVMIGLAVLPPAEFDTREYHLQVPKEWFQAGRISFLPHNVYGNMPLGAEMQSLLAMATWPGNDGWWYGGLVGKLVMSGFAMLGGLAVWCAAREQGWKSAWLGPVLILSTPWVMHIAATGLNENALGLYLFLAAWFLTPRNDTPRNDGATWTTSELAPHAKLGLSGFFLGAAVSVKYTAILFGVPLVLLAVYRVFCRSHGWRAAVVWATMLFVSGSPWLIKNAIHCGNPAYPLLFNVFGGNTRDAAKDAQWRAAHRVPQDARGRAYTARGLVNSGLQVAGRSDWQNGLLIPLALLGAYQLMRARHACTMPLVGYTAWLFLSWWLFTHRLDRFWVPAIPCMAWLAVAAVQMASRAWHGTWFGLLLLASFGHWVFVGATPIRSDVRMLVALQYLRDDPIRVNPWHLFFNQHAAESDAVLLVGDAQPYDLELPVFYNTCFDDCLLEKWLQHKTPRRQWAALHDRNVRWVYYHRGEVRRYRSPGNYGYSDYVNDARFDELIARGVLGAPEHQVGDAQVSRAYPVATTPPSGSPALPTARQK